MTTAITQARAGTTFSSIALVAFMGVALLFVSGMASSATIHDAAHDVRHAAGFPCH